MLQQVNYLLLVRFLGLAHGQLHIKQPIMKKIANSTRHSGAPQSSWHLHCPAIAINIPAVVQPNVQPQAAQQKSK
jgi:hypothetical protein